MKPRAFTLVELVVAIAIIVLLATLLIPGIAAAFANAKQAKCVSNLRQIGAALTLYSNDHESWEVPLSFFTTLDKGGYLSTNSPVWVCPADTRSNRSVEKVGPLSYGINGDQVGWTVDGYWLTSKNKTLALRHLAHVVYFADGIDYYMGATGPYNASFRHRNNINALFFDSHVETLSFSNTNDFYKLLRDNP